MPPEPIRYINGWTGEVVEQTFSNLGRGDGSVQAWPHAAGV